MNIDLLIFDLDGTLVDSKYDLADSLNYAAKKLGYGEIPESEIPDMVGDGVRMLISRAFNLDLETEELQLALDTFMEYYEGHLTDRTEFYPYVQQTIKHFKNKKMAVLSNKPDHLTKPIIKELGLDSHFNIVLGATSHIARKPSAEPIEYILNELGVSPEKAMMVGDGDADVMAGKNAGIKTCGLTYGYRSREELEQLNPDYILDKIEDLKELVS